MPAAVNYALVNRADVMGDAYGGLRLRIQKVTDNSTMALFFLEFLI
ncbi:hypothetical protein [Nostoc sp.]|nr:hypothetical protein [Nostoc sp.]